MQRQLQLMTKSEVVSAYKNGIRNFQHINIDGMDLAGTNFEGATFYGSSLRGVDFTRAMLTSVQLKSADLVGACLSEAWINASDLIGSDFTDAKFRKTDLTGASLYNADCTRADFSFAHLGGTSFGETILKGAKLTRASLYHTDLSNIDLKAFCDARGLRYGSPCSIDARSVMKSYRHPDLKRFMTDCGVPEIFATYMIDCARALGEPLLKSLMQSTFISYGSPDEAFAEKLYKTLRAHQVIVFFFPKNAKLGERLGSELYQRLHEHDRVLLVCSKQSLNRPAVINEIQETLDRETRDGGATYLLPIMLDDYVLKEWPKVNPKLAERVGSRIIGDFRKAKRSSSAFDEAVTRVLETLMKHRPK